MLTLKEYLEKYKIRQSAFAKRIKKARAYVHRYTEKGTIPVPEEVVAIYVETDGEVEPNDWYNLPKLKSLNNPNKNTT